MGNIFNDCLHLVQYVICNHRNVVWFSYNLYAVACAVNYVCALYCDKLEAKFKFKDKAKNQPSFISSPLVPNTFMMTHTYMSMFTYPSDKLLCSPIMVRNPKNVEARS